MLTERLHSHPAHTSQEKEFPAQEKEFPATLELQGHVPSEKAFTWVYELNTVLLSSHLISALKMNVEEIFAIL